MFSLLKRVYTSFAPPELEKHDKPLRFGILGAATIAPMTIITPAKSHPDVVVQVVAARDRARAEKFAKQHGIPEVRDTYEEILDDPNIDAVLIPLPNGLHYEWAVRAIRAGKHVLLEKPSVNNQEEALKLFRMPELSAPNAPVILEACHSRFHPAVHKMLSFVSPRDVEHVYTDVMVPWLFIGKDRIEFNYKLGGGSIMALGTYNFAMLRMIFDDEPEACTSCMPSVWADGVRDRCDYRFESEFRFPNGGTASATATIQGPLLWKPSEARVTHRPVVVDDDKSLPNDQEKVRTRQVTLHGYMHAVLWHRIDVKDTFVIRTKADARPMKTWVESSSHKAYSFRDVEGKRTSLDGEDWWMSYRYQLEEFVNRVKGRATSYWIDGEDSIDQMRMVDMAYEKSGLGLRPTSDYA